MWNPLFQQSTQGGQIKRLRGKRRGLEHSVPTVITVTYGGHAKTCEVRRGAESSSRERRGLELIA